MAEAPKTPDPTPDAAPSKSGSSVKKWGISAVKLAVVALLVWGIHRTLSDAWHELTSGEVRLDFHAGFLLLAGVFYILAFIPSAVFWHRLLGTLGVPLKWLDTFRAFYIGHLGKYVPGKAMVVILRTSLVRTERMPVGAVAATVFYETLTMMAVGAFVSAAVLGTFYRQHWWLTGLAVLLMLAAGVPTFPPLFAWLTRLVGIGKKHSDQTQKLAQVSYGLFASGWVSIICGWIVMGLSLWAVLRGMGLEVSLSELPLVTAAVALAVVGGFLSLIPGGMGVRELVLIPLLVTLLGEDAQAHAVVAAILLRLIWLVSELVVSAMLYGTKWLGPVKSSRETPAAV